MNTITIIITAVFVILACIDSYAVEHHKSRICKIFLVPILILILILHQSQEAFLYTALTLCWLGDVLLIRKTKKCMLTGGISFFLGHLSYFFFFLSQMERLDPVQMCIIAVPYLLYAFFFVKKIFPNLEGEMRILGYGYLPVILSMSCMSMCVYAQRYALGSLIAAMGTVFFCISDTFLVDQASRHLPQRGVMITYAAAQLLIVIGQIL